MRKYFDLKHLISYHLMKGMSSLNEWAIAVPIIRATRGEGIFFTEIEILNDINGKPYIFFSGKTKKFIEKKEKKFKAKLKFDISLSDDTPFVIAFVVISLAPYV